MAAFSDLFDVLISKYGSGWKGASLQVKNWVRPPELAAHPSVVCLTVEALTADEFDAYVDEVIAQLQDAKKLARKKLARINREAEKSKIVHAMKNRTTAA